jgi:ABC-2 type transport system ATP-binding protein
MSVIIQVDHLSKEYKELKAVDNLSFTVHQGDVYGFLGQNGAGKSTTIRMLLTLIEPSAGNIQLFELDLKKHRKEILQQVGAVIERPDLYKYLTAYESLSLFARMSGVKKNRQKLMDQLEQVGLQDRAHSKVKTFSQGMKQRLGIAVAMVHDPQLIILDEPTNGLDPQGIADIRQLIINLSKQHGKTILVSSHLLYEIEMTANRMIIIDKGKKITEGSVQEMFDPSRMQIAVTVNNIGPVMEQLQQSPWKSHIKEQQNNTILFQLAEQQVPDLTTYLVQAGAAITSLQPRHSLEAYFLALTTTNRHVDTPAN